MVWRGLEDMSPPLTPISFLGLSALFWLGLAFAAILLGLLREALLAPRVPHAWAQGIGGGLLCLVVTLAAGLLVHLGAPGAGMAWAAGALWVVLTLVLDLTLLLWVRRQPWAAFWALFDVRRGEALPAVLLISLIGPPAAQSIV